jgi:hypothetical protein
VAAVLVELVEAARELAHRDVHRTRHVAGGELVGLADVDGGRTALDQLSSGVDGDFTHLAHFLPHPPMGSCQEP